MYPCVLRVEVSSQTCKVSSETSMTSTLRATEISTQFLPLMTTQVISLMLYQKSQHKIHMAYQISKKTKDYNYSSNVSWKTRDPILPYPLHNGCCGKRTNPTPYKSKSSKPVITAMRRPRYKELRVWGQPRIYKYRPCLRKKGKKWGKGREKRKERHSAAMAALEQCVEVPYEEQEGKDLLSLPIFLSSHQAWVSSSTYREDISIPVLCTKNPNLLPKSEGWTLNVWVRKGCDLLCVCAKRMTWLSIIVYICNNNTQETWRVWVNIETLSKRVEREKGRKAEKMGEWGCWRGASTWVTGFLWLFQELQWI